MITDKNCKMHTHSTYPTLSSITKSERGMMKMESVNKFSFLFYTYLQQKCNQQIQPWTFPKLSTIWQQ